MSQAITLPRSNLTELRPAMPDPFVIFAVVTIVALAGLTRSVFGFGDALVAMPLLSLVVELRIATPLVTVVAFAMGASILVQYRRHLQLNRFLGLFFLAALPGIPVGIFLLRGIEEAPMKLALGILILLYAAFSLAHTGSGRPARSGTATYGLGFLAGILGGAYNIAGPPIVVLGSLKQWPPPTFRANLQSFFLPIGLALVLSRAAAGQFTGPVLALAGFALPANLLALLLGRRIARRLPASRFHSLVYWIIALLGALLLWQSIANL